MKKPRPGRIPSPFADGGLHLAVLSALIDEEYLSEDELEAALEDTEGESETELLQNGMARLHRIPLPAKALAKITALDFDGGNVAYMTLEECVGTCSGGETDAYCLRSLEGISALSALESLDFDGHGGSPDEPLDLAPLAHHPALKSLWMAGKFTHAAVLDTLPKLTQVTSYGSELDDPEVFARLRARGVEILGSDA